MGTAGISMVSARSAENTRKTKVFSSFPGPFPPKNVFSNFRKMWKSWSRHNFFNSPGELKIV